ncbi:MAG TPA: SDR family oxidoreductase [Solirubrobacterales bacterium]|jgi:nucleoside-diphosphate-sugar epimerase|nr:SDR family oxidoreductase [Solirubrobacterales bacterium]
MHDTPQIFLTGASGVLGVALTERLEGTPLTCLTHRQPITERARHEEIQGDVTKPRLGLAQMSYAELAQRTEVVVHAAASTDFSAEPDEIKRLNVEGTKSALELATAAEASIIYVSTAFVDRIDVTLASGLDSPAAAGRNAYLESKLLSEQLVAASGIPHAIARPSVVIGDSKTAQIARAQGLHMMLRAYCKGTLPFIPMGEASSIDFIPQDLVAEGLARLALLPVGELPSQPVWLTAGPAAVTVEQMAIVAGQVLADCGVEVSPPRYFGQEVLDRLIVPAFLETLPEELQQRMWNFLVLTTLFSTALPFPSSFGEMGFLPGAAATQDLAEALRRTIEVKCLPKDFRPSGAEAGS